MAKDDNTFLKKAKEFEAEKTLKKFQRMVNLRFSDGTFMGLWFYTRKDDICSSDLEVCIRIAKQYEECLNSIDKNFEEKLKSFINENNLNKFNQNNKTIKFEDGKLMPFWFMSYKKILLSSTNKCCKMVQQQYQEYIKMQADKKQMVFSLHLKEFVEMPNLDKFMKQKDILFSDGVSMNSWYNNNKDNLKDNDEIQRQYDMFKRNKAYEKEKRDKKTKINFECKIQEFLSIKSSYKFKSFNNLKFSDDSLVGGWFQRNEKKLSANYSEQYLIMLEQKRNYEKKVITGFEDDKVIKERIKGKNDNNGE